MNTQVVVRLAYALDGTNDLLVSDVIRTNEKQAWLVQVAVFGAAAALTKFEGAPRIGVVVVVLAIDAALARRRAGILPALVLALAASGGWLVWTVLASRDACHKDTAEGFRALEGPQARQETGACDPDPRQAGPGGVADTGR